MPQEHRVNLFVDWLYGKDAQNDDVGAVARHVSAHVRQRPAVGHAARWPDLEALKTSVRHYGPPCTVDQVETAIAAFEG